MVGLGTCSAIFPFSEVEGTPFVVPPYFFGVEIKIVVTRFQLLRLKFA